MSTPEKIEWLMVQLYYNEPWEEFLVKAVKPFMDTAAETGIAVRYFFLRSYERGPHIRLYFGGNLGMLEEVLKPNLAEHFNNYFEAKPSFLLPPNYPSDYPERFRWLPNNSIHYQKFTPDFLRFGGIRGFYLASRQFHTSSEMVLKDMEQSLGRWSTDEANSIAIKLHLSLAFAMGFSLVQTAHFFDLLLGNWKKESINTPYARYQHNYRKAFDLQKSTVLPYTSAIWRGLTDNQFNEQRTYLHWYFNNTNIIHTLRQEFMEGKIDYRPVQWLISNKYSEKDTTMQLWSFFADYVFFTNNRLGILRQNEGYLFYQLKESLRMMVNNPSLIEASHVSVEK